MRPVPPHGAKRRLARRAPTVPAPRPPYARAAAALTLAVVALVLVAAVILLLALPTSPAAALEAAPGDVWVTQAEGIIDPALAGFLVDTMEDAAAAQAEALVVELDTPGGLDSSMREIIQAQLDAPIPIVFFVYPQGARAASAGVYILMGADVAAMAPQTNLGAATPVSLGEEMDEVMQAKVTNDAAAYIRGLATTHERNADWAERAVREAVSLTAQEALEQGVIEFVAADVTALMEKMDGYVTIPKGLTLETAGAPIHEVSMGWIQRFLHLLANPNIAYVLMTLGVLGIILEISSPGIGAGGIVGVISLLLAFYSFQVLPVSFVGIALIVLAVALLVAEIFVSSHGILGIGGAIALILGGLLLFDTSAEYLQVSWPVLLAVAAIVLAFFLIVIRAITKARHRPVVTGVEGLAGATGTVLTSLVPEGQVWVQGERWSARSEGGDLLKDEEIEVLREEGLTLVVQKHQQPEQPEPRQPGQPEPDRGE